ncbi:hypothetical protein BC827DRAFT_1155967 [Russula dissimulans]|nr:hypothetical protein BC827DRAFT_1155967 [Russula dissimulans]
MAPLSDLSSPPPFPPFPPPLPGDKPGLCGLTGDQWHVLLIFLVLILLVLPIALIVSWHKSKDPCFLWLEAQQRAEMARTGLREKLLKPLLTENDIRLIALDPDYMGLADEGQQQHRIAVQSAQLESNVYQILRSIPYSNLKKLNFLLLANEPSRRTPEKRCHFTGLATGHPTERHQVGDFVVNYLAHSRLLSSIIPQAPKYRHRESGARAINRRRPHPFSVLTTVIISSRSTRLSYYVPVNGSPIKLQIPRTLPIFLLPPPAPSRPFLIPDTPTNLNPVQSYY